MLVYKTLKISIINKIYTLFILFKNISNQLKKVLLSCIFLSKLKKINYKIILLTSCTYFLNLVKNLFSMNISLYSQPIVKILSLNSLGIFEKDCLFSILVLKYSIMKN